MAGSQFGEIFRISTWGESHGAGLGVVIDGCPAGIVLGEDDFSEDMARRRPGQSGYATPRSEEDRVEILSGIFEGKTTGTPISLVIRNTSQRSSDYSDIAGYYRPGHADRTYDDKYGFRDYRGGGRSSGRETAARVAAGVVAKKLLQPMGINTTAYVKKIGSCECGLSGIPDKKLIESSPLRIPDPEVSRAAEAYLKEKMSEGDSAGAIVECITTGVPAGLGDPVFSKLDALLGQAVFSIGAVKGVEFGAGFEVAEMSGFTNNDIHRNNAGGILGGISTGDDIVLRAAFKPTPSISKEQSAYDRQGNEITVSVRGRHDPLVAARAVVVVESMVNIVLADRILINMGSRADNITELYNKLNKNR
ncbi:MAG: chorismate synthase [Eubacterium sp.]|nr:chorismate synthase [Eubacterium sp.]